MELSYNYIGKSIAVLSLNIFCSFGYLLIRSPTAYGALKSFNILQLPCQSILKAYTGTFMHDPGARNDCIVDQVSVADPLKGRWLVASLSGC